VYICDYKISLFKASSAVELVPMTSITLIIILALLVVVLIIESEESAKYLLKVLRELSLSETLFLIKFEVSEQVLSALLFISLMVMLRYMNMRMPIIIGPEGSQVGPGLENVLVFHGLRWVTLAEKFVLDFLRR
jgi:hypothetical protein